LFSYAVLPEWSHVANGPVVLGLVKGFWRFKSQSDRFVNGSKQKAAIYNKIVELKNTSIEKGIQKTKKATVTFTRFQQPDKTQ
jgi:hypothetical protein